MNWITEKSILDAANKINELSGKELEIMSEENVGKQPDFVYYLFSAGEELEDEEIPSLVIYYFNIFFEAAKYQGIEFKTIDNDFIDDFEEEYMEVLDQYNHTEDDDLIKVFCNQPVMIDFLISEISGEDEDGNILSQQTQINFFIVGIALVALMNRAIIK